MEMIRERRTENIHMRVTMSDKIDLSTNARIVGMTLTDYLLYAAHKLPAIDPKFKTKGVDQKERAMRRAEFVAFNSRQKDIYILQQMMKIVEVFQTELESIKKNNRVSILDGVIEAAVGSAESFKNNKQVWKDMRQVLAKIYPQKLKKFDTYVKKYTPTSIREARKKVKITAQEYQQDKEKYDGYKMDRHGNIVPK